MQKALDVSKGSETASKPVGEVWLVSLDPEPGPFFFWCSRYKKATATAPESHQPAVDRKESTFYKAMEHAAGPQVSASATKHP